MKEEFIKYIGGVIITGTLAWATWVTSALFATEGRLGRIETKIDIVIERLMK